MSLPPVVAVAALCLSVPSAAARLQADAPDAVAGATARATSVGWSHTDDSLRAEGPAFEARFDAHGLAFTPALGEVAYAPSLRLDALDVRRGAGAPLALSPAAPRRDGARVTYERAPGVEERFDVDARGAEQSFLLASPPAGDGDLVVRCRLGGELAALDAEPDADGLVLAGPEGGVQVGAVTGVDADGRRCTGSLRRSGDVLELVLPDAFVDVAAWPLLVDPLIGAVFPIDGSSWDDDLPDVAYDETTGHYLVVWARTFSATDTRIRGQRVDASGALVGGTIFFDSNATVLGRPRVANVNPSDRFLVTWVEGTGVARLIGQACDADDGALSAATILETAFFASIDGHDVGGEARALFPTSDAVVVWHETGVSPGVWSQAVGVPASGDPVPGTSTQLYQDSPPAVTTSAPSISSTGGALGQYLLAFRSFVVLIGNTNIVGLALDRQGLPLTPAATLVSTPAFEGDPVVDGGATLTPEYVVAYSQDPFPTLYDLEAVVVGIEDGELVTRGTSVLAQSQQPFFDYDVAWTPGRATVVYAEQPGTANAYAVWTQDVDTTDGGLCGARASAGTFRPQSGALSTAIASIASGGRVGLGEALIAFAYETGGAAGNVYGQQYDALFGGSTSDLGGGCGTGGTISPYGHPVIGNGYFQLTLIGADPNAVATVLNVTTPTTPLTCGPCTWLPFQAATSYAVLNGASQVVLSIPCDTSLVGQAYEAQFTTLTPGTSPCPLVRNVSVSDRLLVQIGG